MGGSKHTGSSPCASCKLLRRRCARDCIFAPYFPADDPYKFACVHKVFGASNVSKMLQELPVANREDAVGSLVYEANARIRNPVYGCVSHISCLEEQVDQLKQQLVLAKTQIGLINGNIFTSELIRLNSNENFDSKQVMAMEHQILQNNYQIAYPSSDHPDQFHVQSPDCMGMRKPTWYAHSQYQH
ncbi:hypothetical protein KI387_037272 [Taxus chinensis]|uniref:LOB domain-containing protein n=1 Tax=Taxus chinensis TaxID=29808 RepID=A0AA38C7F0_TAXCH|nr:hypothetical protein KI387_042525 [Taxus chinensis]KAH9309361.1 hypothetical protein KI387_037272 [Taxus chinensis]